MFTDTPLPAGTITFLFTDIQGSTPLWERAPEKMGAALQIHNAALRQAIETHGGVIFKTVGDAFQAAFATAPQALKAAIDGQRALQSAPWNELGPLNVRMGLHTGEAELDPGGDEYAVSHAKNRIGRIHSVAYGGQIVLSQETADLVRLDLTGWGDAEGYGRAPPEGHAVAGAPVPGMRTRAAVEFSPTGNRHYSSHAQPAHPADLLHRAGEGNRSHYGLAAEHPPGDADRPGRDGQDPPGAADRRRAAGAVPRRRLAGGAGSVVGPGPGAAPVRPAPWACASSPARRRLTLLLEYLEQKAAAADPGQLRAPDRGLRAPGGCAAASLPEAAPSWPPAAKRWGLQARLPSACRRWTCPTARPLPPLETLAQSEAVRLFVERAATASPGFSLTAANAPAIAAGLPAPGRHPAGDRAGRGAGASCCRWTEIAQRLDDRFRLLTGGSRTALPRHQTLRASIDWSYGLLSEPERAPAAAPVGLCGRLDAGGGRSASAAGRVIQACDVLDLLGQLVDKSLIQTGSVADGLSRFRMLETIRQYAHEKLVEFGQAEAARQRHLQYYLELAETLENGIRGPDQVRIQDRLETELDNLRLALAWSLEGRGRLGWNPELGLRLASSLLSFLVQSWPPG